MFTSTDNKGKLFSLLCSDKYTNERLLLPTSTNNTVVTEKQNKEAINNLIDETKVQLKPSPPATGYIKYPAYDFF